MYYSTIFQKNFYPTIIQPNQPKQKESYLSFSGYYCVCKNAANKTPTIQTELFSSYSKSNNKNKPEKINVSYSFSFLCVDYKGIFFISCLLPWAAKIEAGWEDEKKRYAENLACDAATTVTVGSSLLAVVVCVSIFYSLSKFVFLWKL